MYGPPMPTEHPTPELTRPTAETIAAGHAALGDLLGSDRVATGADQLIQHGSDEGYHAPVPPDIVVWPRTIEEAADIVRVAAAHHLPVIPFGAGTSMEGHIAALAGGICVDMREMNRISAPSLENLSVAVEAGVTRLQLDTRLRPEGVFFSVDPGSDATIGGMIATGASGTTTVRYGTMRENVINLTVVTAAGEVVRTRSLARKSSAGYDLTRLMIGSEGTLALICEATLKVHPTPDAIAAGVCTFPTVAAAVQCSVELGLNAIPVARVELVDEMVIEAMNRRHELTLTVAPTLFLEFNGASAAEVEAQAREAAAIAAQNGGGELEWATDEAARRRLWRARHSALDASKALRPAGAVLGTDVCVPVSALADCITSAQSETVALGLTATIVGHVGDGNFHMAVLIDPEDEDEVNRAEEFHTRLVRAALANDGTCTGEHGIGYSKTRFLIEEHGRAGVEMMRAIKHALDPDGIFNPGKTVAGVEAE